MMLKEQVFAQAALLAGALEERQLALLQVLCGAAASSLTARLRDGISPEDCKEDFVAAASLYALSALNDADADVQVEEFKAGDLTVKQGTTSKNAVSRCLEQQADRIILPYLKDCFSFLGV